MYYSPLEQLNVSIFVFLRLEAVLERVFDMNSFIYHLPKPPAITCWGLSHHAFVCTICVCCVFNVCDPCMRSMCVHKKSTNLPYWSHYRVRCGHILQNLIHRSERSSVFCSWETPRIYESCYVEENIDVCRKTHRWREHPMRHTYENRQRYAHSNHNDQRGGAQSEF